MATKGTRGTGIAFGDFEIQVSLVKATGSRDVKLERIDADGCKLGSGGGPAARRGVDVAAGESYALRVGGEHVIRVPQDELDAIQRASKERWGSMRVLECINYRQVPTERIQGAYWLQPAHGSARGLYLLHKALRDRDMVAVVKWVAASREKLGVIGPQTVRKSGGYHRAPLLLELAFANDFVAPDEDVLAINDAERMLLDDPRHLEMVEAARGLVDAFTRQPGDPKAIDEASDGAVDARLALIERLRAEDLDHSLVASLDAPDADIVVGERAA